MSQRQGKVKCQTSNLGMKGKRKLLPLRSRNMDFTDSSPNTDPVATDTPKFPDAGQSGVQAKKAKTTLSYKEKSHQSPKRAGKQGTKPAQPRTLVCTFMHREEVEFVSNAVSKLGGFDIEKTVTLRTTHIVCGDEKRTLNLMKGIAYGCWVLNKDWVRESLKAQKWLEEEPYELKSFPAIKECRMARETFGGKICDIFNNGELYYVAVKTSPPSPDLISLLQLCGGKVESSLKTASLVISPKPLDLPPAIVSVTEKWVLDSLVMNKLQDMRKYRSN